MDQIICDVAIIGAGPAGLAAAVETSSKGLKTVIFDKMKKTGGLRDGGIGPFAVESFVQEQQYVDLSREQAFNYLMEFTHWTTDARLVSEYINMSADTISWLSNFGIRFESASAYYKGGKETQHNFNFMGKSIAQVLTEQATQHGTTYYLGTTVERLTKEHGTITGFTGVDAGGNAFSVKAKAVIVATGGFAGDNEMVRQVGYTKDVDIMYTFEMDCTCGDGLRMIWDVGGKKAPMMLDTYVGLTKGYGGPMGTAPALACLRQPVNVMVNQKGFRFMREDLCSNPGYTGNAVHHQYRGCAVAILDENLYQLYQKENAAAPLPSMEIDPEAMKDMPPREPQPFERFNGIPMDVILRNAIADGSKDFFIADSLEEFAEKAEIPFVTLQETLAEYNQMCDLHEDNIFHKKPKYLKRIDGPRYYGARFFCDTYGGLGGVQINYRAQVLDQEEEPIPGLYCAGNDANTIYGGSYPFYLCGNTSSFALNTGRMAGKSICKELGKE